MTISSSATVAFYPPHNACFSPDNTLPILSSLPHTEPIQTVPLSPSLLTHAHSCLSTPQHSFPPPSVPVLLPPATNQTNLPVQYPGVQGASTAIQGSSSPLLSFSSSSLSLPSSFAHTSSSSACSSPLPSPLTCHSSPLRLPPSPLYLPSLNSPPPI
jgi:hypothetical protein